MKDLIERQYLEYARKMASNKANVRKKKSERSESKKGIPKSVWMWIHNCGHKWSCITWKYSDKRRSFTTETGAALLKNVEVENIENDVGKCQC